MEPIKVGIIGFGRSGYGIHADAISKMRDMFTVVAICDFIPERRQHEAFPNARPYASAEELVADPDVELVVVSTFNCLHAPVARLALAAGKHVLCEKPFGFTVADVDSMIELAQKNGRVLQPFQQRRFEEGYRKVMEIANSGVLGKLTYVQLCMDGFSRRWDWQTSRKWGGGQLYNNMPHWIDHAMEFFEDVDPEVQCLVRSSLSSGQAEDEVYITLTAPCHPIVRAEITCTGAFKRDAYMINGTKGSLRGNDKKLEWKYVDWSEMPVRNLDMNPLEGRVYCSEELKWECGSWEATGQTDNGAGAKPAPGPVKELYMSLYESIRNGAPQRITPQNVRRRVAVLEQCYRLNQIEFPAEVLGR